METKVQNFVEVYNLINSTVYNIFDRASRSKYRGKLNFYKCYYSNWRFFNEDVWIEYYIAQDPDFRGMMSIPLEVIINNTWEEYIDSGEWTKQFDERETNEDEEE